jgi:hypothetical protein
MHGGDEGRGPCLATAQAAEGLAAATAPQPLAAAPEEAAAQGQAALLSIVQRLAQAAERLAEATVWNSQRREHQPDTFKTLSESIADSTILEERSETTAPPDLAIAGGHSETADPPDLTAPRESAEAPDNKDDE